MPLSEAKVKLLAQRLAGKGRTGAPRTPTVPVRPAGTEDLLAPGQRRLWFHFQANPDSPSHNVTSSYSFRGELDPGLVERAANRVVARHEILRGTFLPQGSSATQIINNDFRLDVERIVTTHRDQLRALARAEATKPFDLTARPPIRLLYLRSESENEGLLMLLIHHLVFDEWSMGIFWTEFVAAHRQLSNGEGTDPPPVLPIQYADFAAWQRMQQEAGTYASQLDYWRGQLARLPDAPELPFDRPRAVGLTDAGSVETLRFDPELTLSIKKSALQADVSPFMVLLAGFGILLHRYTGAEDIIVGTPVANRKAPELANLIGFFLSTVAIRADFSGDPPAAEILTQIRRTVLDAFDHLDAPFDQVVDAVKPRRIPGEHPVFQVMFVYESEDGSTAEIELPGATLKSTVIDTGAAKFDITLFIIERADGIEAMIEYRTELFERVTIQRMLGHLRQVLESMTRNPESRVSEIALLTAEERFTLLHSCQSPPAQAAAAPVIQSTARWVKETPNAVAIVDGDQRQTYAEIFARADNLAGALAAKGFGEGDHIGLFLARSADAMVGILGIHLAGAAYVPIDPSYPTERQRFVMKDCGTRVIVTNKALRSSLGTTPAEIIFLDALAETHPPPQPSSNLDAPAYVIYTSGSTGQPKGVVVSQQNLAWSTTARQNFYPDQPARFLLIPSLSFDSSIAGIFWTLQAGGSLVLMPDKLEQDIDALAELIAAEEITHILCLPSLYELLLQYGDPAKLATLTTVMVAGEACPARLARRHAETLPSAALFNEYGPTEATVWCTAQQVTAAADPVPIGKPIPGATIYLLDGHGQLVPPGVPGEIYIGGAGIAPGYLHRPELTNARFVPDRFAEDSQSARLYRTGDLARYRRDGTIEFLGRVDDQIKVRGHRIELGEIEAAMRLHSSVGDCAVLARADVSTDALYERMRHLNHEVADKILVELETE